MHSFTPSPLHASVTKPFKVPLKVIRREEQEDAVLARLLPHGGKLVRRRGAREQDCRRRRRCCFLRSAWAAGRANCYPAFVLRGDVFVLDEGEAEFGGVEGDGFVVVAD